MKANPDISQALFAAKNAEKIKELAKEQGLAIYAASKASDDWEAWSSISSYKGRGKSEQDAIAAHFDRLSILTDRIAQLFALWESGLRAEKPVSEAAEEKQ